MGQSNTFKKLTPGDVTVLPKGIYELSPAGQDAYRSIVRVGPGLDRSTVETIYADAELTIKRLR